MDALKTDNWRYTNKRIQEEYKNDNFKIVDSAPDSKHCIIFFASNGAYPQNTNEEIDAYFGNKTKFEWESLSRSPGISSYYGRMIFVRDVFKQWYITGINERTNSVDSMVEFFLENTGGYEITTAGSSAGGYAAALFGALLHAKRSYCFSGQFDLHGFSSDMPFVCQYENDETRNKYFDICNLIKESGVTTYYFYPSQCALDVGQHAKITETPNENLCVFPIKSKEHSVTLLPPDMIKLLSNDSAVTEKIHKRLSGKEVSPLSFMRKDEGTAKTLGYCFHKLRKKLKK